VLDSWFVAVADDEALPVVMAVVRGAFGRHAWTMQLRHQSHCHHKVALLLSTICRGFDISNVLLQYYTYSASSLFHICVIVSFQISYQNICLFISVVAGGGHLAALNF